MADSVTTSIAPVRETERHESLDVLRGVGVLGILVMNIQSFAMPFAAYFNPTALGPPWNYWGSLFSALGWIGLVMTLWKSGAGSGAIRRLAAVGRMAFTCYILETLICTTIFYGHGAGLFGTVGRVGQLVTTVAVWAVLLLLAPWWLERFRYGPLEWLWRTLTYGRIEPFSRERAAPSAAI